MNSLLLSFLGLEFLFLVGGALLVAWGVVGGNDIRAPTTESNVALKLMLEDQSETYIASIANGIITFATFVLVLPAFVMPLNRFFLRMHAWLVVFNGLFTIVLGLILWFATLRTRAEFGRTFAQQSSSVQSLVQNKFDCCGYFNSTSPPFVQDNICTSTFVAEGKEGCVTGFSNFGNKIMDDIFTAFFAIVGADAFVLLGTLAMLKQRDELERYKHIDEKLAVGRI